MKPNNIAEVLIELAALREMVAQLIVILLTEQKPPLLSPNCWGKIANSSTLRPHEDRRN